MQLEKRTILTPDKLGGSSEFKVFHLSELFPDDPWYSSPALFTYVENDESLIVDIVTSEDTSNTSPEVISEGKPRRLFLRGGPRREIFWHAPVVKAAICTCGGISPGLNTVIRELVMCLYYTYGVKEIVGVKNGYQGFFLEPLIPLYPDIVSDIHHQGGTFLGTSRGGFDSEKIIDSIIENQLTHIFIIGGDGTHRGASKIHEELLKRKLKIAVVGIPKTIDNDIPIIDKSFGFDTAVERAQLAIESAHVEANSTVNGIGLVVLMGRASGFIAVHATLASRDVNCCLIPEVPFKLEGPNGLLVFLKQRLIKRGHAVVVVAEGAGADVVPIENRGTDKSGNPVLPEIGIFLKNKIKSFFKEQAMEVNLKYIDPSYIIRSSPANSSDSIYSTVLAQTAVHGAMAGFTGFTVAFVNSHYALIPLEKVTQTRKVNPTDRMWQRVLSTTGQPDFL